MKKFNFNCYSDWKPKKKQAHNTLSGNLWGKVKHPKASSLILTLPDRNKFKAFMKSLLPHSKQIINFVRAFVGCRNSDEEQMPLHLCQLSSFFAEFRYQNDLRFTALRSFLLSFIIYIRETVLSVSRNQFGHSRMPCFHDAYTYPSQQLYTDWYLRQTMTDRWETVYHNNWCNLQSSRLSQLWWCVMATIAPDWQPFNTATVRVVSFSTASQKRFSGTRLGVQIGCHVPQWVDLGDDHRHSQVFLQGLEPPYIYYSPSSK